MSLSKECGQVSSSTSGFPGVPRGSVYYAVLQPGASDYTRDELQCYWRAHDRVQFTADRVQRLFARQVALAERQDLLMADLKHAMAAQVKAECIWKSCFWPVFPELTGADINSVFDLDLPALEVAALDGLQPPVTTTAAAPTATAVHSTTTSLALPSTAVTAVRKPKITLLPLRSPNGSGFTAAAAAGFTAAGFTAATMNRPTKPSKRLNARPVCRKPSKRAAPSTTAEDDLPASTST